MERHKKKDMLKTVDTLLKANDAIVKIAASNPQEATEVLVQCQESAIVMGTYIDTFGEEYIDLVHILEEYCENIYQINENLSDEKTCRKVVKRIQKQLVSLQNSMKYDLPDDKKVAVFLPYKASMWDSLESVWRAADADPDCDAYVIPIPYFDKNPDGSFREEHYEGDQYPKDVPITRYDEYDLEACHPDVIYIHNPYDECNHVTSVHPYFYSKNLRNFTNKLVYIPYFILGEIEPDNQAAIDGMKHFCFTPGTIYAHQVIVQSENMRQIYINEYIKAAKEMGLSGEHVDRKFLEKKFLGTGSPKVDKVLNTKKEDLEIPAEWLKIIEKPDGSWKKIVFYNTSVSALLHHNENMLRKMESVFEIFKEHRDEVALLWRPHPLIKATIESMRPQLWEEYRKIRDQYIAEGWGIYDDSADMDRAVVLSDAYYGDGSSVLHLCREKGMPVMVQNVDTFLKQGNILLSTYGMEYVGEDVYFAAKNIAGLFVYHRKTKKTEQIAVEALEIEEISSRFAFGGVGIYRSKVLFAPYTSSKLLIYDTENQEDISTIDIKEMFNGKEKINNYIKKIVVQDKLIFGVCNKNQEILCLDMDVRQIKIVDSWRKELFLKTGSKDFVGVHTGGDVCIVDDSFWVPISFDNFILEVNMSNLKANIYKINVPQMHFFTICFDGSNFWLTGNKAIIVKWNKNENHAEVFTELPEGFQIFHKENYWDEVFSRSFYEEGYVYLFPLTANMIIKIKTKTGQIQMIYKWDVLESCYSVEKWDENTFYIETGNSNYIDINQSMLMDKKGIILDSNIFTVSSGKVKYKFSKNFYEDYVETQALTLEKWLTEKIDLESKIKNRAEIRR